MANKPKQQQPQADLPQADAAQDPRVTYVGDADRTQVLNINPLAVAVVVYPNGIVTETF